MGKAESPLWQPDWSGALAKAREQDAPGASVLRLLHSEFGLEHNVALAEDRFVAPAIDEGDPFYETLLLEGRVVELCAPRGQGALSVALALLVAAHQRHDREWLLAIAPGLCGYATAALGVPQGRTLVVDVPVQERLRILVRGFKSGVFAAGMCDLRDLKSLNNVVVGVRRLALIAEQQKRLAIILTHPRQRRPLPLPVAVRAECQAHPVVEDEVQVDVKRHIRGVYRSLSFSRPGERLSETFETMRTPSPEGKTQRVAKATQARGHRRRRVAP